MIRTLCYLAAFALALTAAVRTQGRFTVPEYVTITGKDTPEKIPQWAAWETAFLSIQSASTQPRSSGISRFNLPDADRTTLVDLATALHEQRARFERRIDQLRPLIGRVPDAQLNDQQMALQLEWRQAVLDARDRLLEAITPASATTLIAWVDELKANTVVMVPKNELAHYYKPQN
jgi:hypothetical protein